MRPSIILSRLRQDRVIRFALLSFPTAMMPAHAARAGFDALMLDNEHSTWERREIQRMIALHHSAGIDCIVRPASRNPQELYRLLEDGATALMIPMVNSAEETRALVRAVKYPPQGQRSLGGMDFDSDFARDKPEIYMAAANAETLLFAMIETPEAVACVDEIATVPGLSGLFIGPADLSLRLNCFDRWDDPQMLEAQTRVAAAAASHGIAWGRPALNVGDIRQLAALGARIMVYGSDYVGVAELLAKRGKDFSDALGAREN